MAKSATADPISVLKASIAALEEQVAEMKAATDVLAAAQGLPPVYGVVRKGTPGPEPVNEELPPGSFRLDVGQSFSSDAED